MTGMRVVVAALAVTTTALVGGCSSSKPSSAKEAGTTKAPFTLKGQAVATDHVDLPKSYKFEPAIITVKTGTTVTWTNHDDFPHTVQVLAGAPDSTQTLGIGKSVTLTFDQPGTVYYHCSLHPAQMKGEVVVTG